MTRLHGTDARSSSVELLQTLTQADAVPGHETEVLEIFRSRLAGVGTIGFDRLGSIYCSKPGKNGEPRVLLDSHVDEVGFIVQRVTAAGLVQFLPLGGWWPHTLLAQRVRIHTETGKIPGVIGSPPPHTLGPGNAERVLDFGDLFIDIGARTREEAGEWGVRPGCPVVPYSPFLPLRNEDMFSAKAFDNRVGVALVIETLERLGDDHPGTVVGSGSVQEEVGLRGAGTMTRTVKPDLAIVLEGPYADDLPPADRQAAQCRVGGGVHVRLYDPTMIANPRLCDLVAETAEANGLPYQLAVWKAGGTDGGAIHQIGRGVPSIVLGVPVRYIHSHVSVLDINDYLATLELLLHLVSRLDDATVGSIAAPVPV